MEEIEARFIVNLPPEELAESTRLFFQIEQAWWFYEDFYADSDSSLPHFNLNSFAREVFNRSSVLRHVRHRYDELFQSFRIYKGEIPVYAVSC